MDEIVPGLWVGGHRAASDPDYLSRAGITHIVSCMKQRLATHIDLPDGREITEADMKLVRLDDDEKAPILVHFDSCNDFITQILQEEWVADDNDQPLPTGSDTDLLVQGRQKQGEQWGTWQTTGSGTVLVHCQAGCSRSVAIVAAYLMSTRHVTAAEAVEMLQQRRSGAQPNAGFMAQLELYHQVGYQIDMRYQAVRRFLMSRTDILNGDSMDDMLLSYYPSPYPSPGLSGTIKGLTPMTPTDDADLSKGLTSTASPMRSRQPSFASGAGPPPRPRSASFSQLRSFADDNETPPISDKNTEVKVTSSQGKLPGGVTHIRGNEDRDSKGRLAKPSFAGPKLRCKSCRRELAALDHVVLHEPGKGQMAFDHRRRDTGFGRGQAVPSLAPLSLTDAPESAVATESEETPATTEQQQTPSPVSIAPTGRPMQSAASLASRLPPHLAALRGGMQRTTSSSPPSTPRSSMLHSPECTAYFTEPMAWMSALGDGQVTGRLNCPNVKCEAKLGSWDWAGMQCACGAWVTPAFALHRSKVDEL